MVKISRPKSIWRKHSLSRYKNGDKDVETSCYGNLGRLLKSIGHYDRAREYLEKALAIKKEIGNRDGEAQCYGNLETFFHSLCQYDKAGEYLEKALAINIEIGDRDGEASCYENLGALFSSLDQYDKAREYLEKAFAINIENNSRDREASCYLKLGSLFKSLGQYDKAREHLEKSLAIRVEIGGIDGEILSYGNLGAFFQSLGEYGVSQEYLEKALHIGKISGYRRLEGDIYTSLTALFLSIGKYGKADKYLEKAMAIKKESGHRTGETINLEHLGRIAQKRGEYNNAQEYYNRALAINMEIGNRKGLVFNYANLGSCFESLGSYDRAEEYFKKALRLSKEIGHSLSEYRSLCSLVLLKASQMDFEKASSYLFQSIEKFDSVRSSLKDNDQLKISLLEAYGTFPNKLLSGLLSSTEKPEDALYVEELRRARCLADLMATQYSVTQQISSNPQTWYGIQNIITKGDCACLYISVDKKSVRFWILKARRAILFLEREVCLDPSKVTGLVPVLDEFFSESFRGLGILPEENCEDRSFEDTDSMSLNDKNRAPMRDDDAAKDIKTNLHLCHKIIIAPVADLLQEPEIIIVPDSCMYQVPFAALSEKGGKFLSETARIRIVPSLTTLKLIQESPPEYHSQTGALIVGDPEVGEVIYKGRRKTISQLPCARNEASMIGRLLGVTPLIADRATKEAVLEVINSVSLIHLAAHGDAERGEILLCPKHLTPSSIPREEAYLLTMADISQIKLRAKLVVLSCCHSARGQIRAEGVIGIARAFIGSGARSVLAARWALVDTATEQFMNCFYEHLFRGESASESLHEARKWMRNNGFEDVSKWASFMLIGDNVTFDFGDWWASTTPEEPGVK